MAHGKSLDKGPPPYVQKEEVEKKLLPTTYVNREERRRRQFSQRQSPNFFQKTRGKTRTRSIAYGND